MKYTVRFAHLGSAPKWKVGDIIQDNDVVGVMGTSGQSTAAHLHIDCVVGEQNKPYKLADIGPAFAPDQKELAAFINKDLFGVAPVITTQFMDPAYHKQFGKDHPAYDVVPEDRHDTDAHFSIHWPRSMPGHVALVVYQPESYGHCLYVTFEDGRK